MITAVEIVQVVVSILLIVIILIQGGENVDMAAAFGGGSSAAAFGPRGAVTMIAKITWVLGAIFMITSITLAIWATRPGSGSVLQHAPAQQTVPVNPAPAPAKK